MYTKLKRKDQVLIEKVAVAQNFFSRFLGLMGKAEVKSEEGLLFPSCNSIHTFFMRIPIDVVFLSAEGTVVQVLKSLKPWRMLMPIPKAKHALELKAQRASELKIEIGEQLKCEGVF